MAISYRIYKEMGVVYCRGEGHIELQDLLDHIDTLAHDPAYAPPMKKLVDYRASQLRDLSSEEIRAFTARKVELQDRLAGERCALVVSGDYDFGMSMLHIAHVDEANIETKAFRDIDDALAWLDVPLQPQDLALTE